MSTPPNWKNVNNWHWVEKNYSTAVKDFVSTIKTSKDFASVESASFEGEFVANVRKGKIILIYDYKLALTFKDDVLGKRVFNVEVDSTDDDFCKLGMTDQERATFLPVISRIVHALSDFIESKARVELLEKSQTSNHQHIQKMVLDVSQASNIPTASTQASFCCQWSFTCPYEVLRECLVGSLYPVWSRSQKENDLFTVHGGLVMYKLISENDGYLELMWKLRSWSDYSVVKINCKSECGRTVVQLCQNSVDSEFVSNAEENWEQYFWNPISVLTGSGFEKHEYYN